MLACANAAEALGLAARHVGPLHLLLTDVVMPGMNGRELAERLLQSRPGLRVLFTSGYGEDVIARHGVLEAGRAAAAEAVRAAQAREPDAHGARRLSPRELW